jgi:hypothetical protein
MLEELRLNPRSQAAHAWSRCPGGRAVTGRGGVGRGLSTGFARLPSLRSTDALAAVHTGSPMKEVVG